MQLGDIIKFGQSSRMFTLQAKDISLAAIQEQQELLEQQIALQRAERERQRQREIEETQQRSNVDNLDNNDEQTNDILKKIEQNKFDGTWEEAEGTTHHTCPRYTPRIPHTTYHTHTYTHTRYL
jgi:hypothetical protein